MLVIGIGVGVVIAIGIGVAAALGLFSSRGAQVSTLSGKVETRFGSQGTFGASEVGQKLKADDSIRTGADGKALLILDDGTGMRLAENSLLDMTRIEGTSDNPIIRLTLNAGKLFNILPTEHTGNSEFQIETPTGVVAVRGSMLSVAYSSSTGTEATCLSGHCEVTVGSQTAALTTGKAATVDPQQKLSAVVDMNADQKFAWVPVIDEARKAGVAVDQAVQPGCACSGKDLVCQDGTTVPFYPTCTTEHQRPPTPAVAFMRQVNGKNALFFMNGDGSGVRQVIATPEDITGFKWSPDGQKLMFITEYPSLLPPEGQNSTMVDKMNIVNLDGSGLRTLIEPPPGDYGFYIKSFAISPDGSWIIADYLSATIGNSGTPTFVGVNVDSGAAHVIASYNNQFFAPVQWTVDGKQATAYIYHSIGDFGIYTFAPDGSNQVKLNSDFGTTHPVWSPDGKRLAYINFKSDPSGTNLHDLFVMNADGSNKVQLTQLGTVADNLPVWSPDGSRIAIRAYKELPSAQNSYASLETMYVVAADGGAVTDLAGQPTEIAYDDNFTSVWWLPDGSGLLYQIHDKDFQSNSVESARADGSGVTPLFAGIYSYMYGLSADGTQILVGLGGDYKGLYVAGVDGNNPVLLTDNGFSPLWQPTAPAVQSAPSGPTATPSSTELPTPTATKSAAAPLQPTAANPAPGGLPTTVPVQGPPTP